MSKPDPLYYFRKAGLEERYKKRGQQASRGVASAAVVLKCIECSGMEFTEAKRCKDVHCPLFPLNLRFIQKKSQQKKAAAERRKDK